MKQSLIKHTITTLLFMALSCTAAAQNGTANSAAAASPANGTPIATLTQIADQSLNTQKLIEKLKPLIVQPLEFEELNDKLGQAKKQAVVLQTQTSDIINNRKSTIDQIRASQSQWRLTRDQLSKDQQKIRDRGSELEGAIAQLNAEEQNWKQIQQNIKATPDLNYDSSSIRSALSNISNLRKQLSVPLQEAITIEGEWQDLIDQCDDAQTSLKNDEITLRSNLLANIQEPLWELSSSDFQIDSSATQLLKYQAKQLGHYGSRYLSKILFIFFCIAGIAVFLQRLHQFNKSTQKDKIGIGLQLPLLDHPFSTLATFSIFIALLVLPYPPQLLKSILLLLLFIPVTRLGLPRLPSTIRPLAWLVSLFFIINEVTALTVVIPALQRIWVFSCTVVGFAGCIYVLRRLSSSEKKSSALWRILRISIWLAMFAALVAMIGDVLGAIILSQFLITGVAYATYAALCLVVLAGVLNDIAVAAIYMPASEISHLISSNRSLLVRYFSKFTSLIFCIYWIYFTLFQFSLWDGFINTITQFLSQELKAGSLSISVGDILSVTITIWLSFKISRFLRFILMEDIAPRTNMVRGVPEAISTLMQYFIVLIGFMAAIGMTGIDISKLTIIVGALGVGIGIGLQDVVSNFTSGLILLFEQNIKVADTVQLSNINGEVLHIGMRCSIIRTSDGAEVIVPNSKLTSDQVINWTRSGQKRRVTVAVSAASNTDPQKVINILLETADNDSDIANDPHPVAHLVSFGPGIMNFELRAWVNNGESYSEANSRLCVSVANALLAAGINIPHQQQDVYIKHYTREK